MIKVVFFFFIIAVPFIVKASFFDRESSAYCCLMYEQDIEEGSVVALCLTSSDFCLD